MIGYQGYDATHAYVISDYNEEFAFRNVRDALRYCIENKLTCPITYKAWDWTDTRVG